jgi:hypothetical protein
MCAAARAILLSSLLLLRVSGLLGSTELLLLCMQGLQETLGT